MSLEQAIAENTAAVRELIAVWSKLNTQAQAVDKMPAETKVEAAGKPVKAAPEKAKAQAKPEAAAAPTEAEAPAAPAASSVDYPTLQKAVFALANAKGRDAVIGLMKDTFGVGSAKELKPGQWAEALAAVNAAAEA